MYYISLASFWLRLSVARMEQFVMPASQDSLTKGFSFQENMLLYALLMGF